MKARLITIEEVAQIVNKEDLNKDVGNYFSMPSYECLLGSQDYGYWTATNSTGNNGYTYAWKIGRYGYNCTSLGYLKGSNGTAGIRPVITVNKNVLE